MASRQKKTGGNVVPEDQILYHSAGDILWGNAKFSYGDYNGALELFQKAADRFSLAPKYKQFSAMGRSGAGATAVKRPTGKISFSEGDTFLGEKITFRRGNVYLGDRKLWSVKKNEEYRKYPPFYHYARILPHYLYQYSSAMAGMLDMLGKGELSSESAQLLRDPRLRQLTAKLWEAGHYLENLAGRDYIKTTQGKLEKHQKEFLSISEKLLEGLQEDISKLVGEIGPERLASFMAIPEFMSEGTSSDKIYASNPLYMAQSRCQQMLGWTPSYGKEGWHKALSGVVNGESMRWPTREPKAEVRETLRATPVKVNMALIGKYVRQFGGREYPSGAVVKDPAGKTLYTDVLNGFTQEQFSALDKELSERYAKSGKVEFNDFKEAVQAVSGQ